MRNATLKSKGFTLMELVIVITIIAILSVVSSKPLIQGYTAYLANKKSIDALWQARHAIEYMSRELRLIRGPTDVVITGTNQIKFTTIDGKTITYSVNSAKELVRLDEQGLNKNELLAEGVQELKFTYYDQAGLATIVPTAIRYIKIDLHIVKGISDFVVSASITPRNLG